LNAEFVKEKLSVDRHGMAHLTLQQVYKDVPVLHSSIKLHTNINGNLSGISSSYLPGINVAISPRLNVSQALEYAKSDFGITRAGSKGGELVIFNTEAGPKLAYDISIGAAANASRYIIDANDGSILKTYPLIYQQGPVKGVGINVLGETIDSLNIYEGSSFEWEDVRAAVDSFSSLFG